MHLTREYPRYKIAVLEKEAEVAQHQTGHNSGVIHAGIYYAPGSQKANFCATGGKLLREFCDERGIQYEMCGKLIVAINDDEVPRLEELYRRGTANGAEGLEMIGPERLRELEPHAAGVRAIWSPNTGIIDFTEVSQAYSTEMLEAGGDLISGARVTRITRNGGDVRLETTAGDLSVKHVINCAGLQADQVARMMGVDIGVRIIPFRGEYYSLKRERVHLVKGLLYPVPDPSMPFLGVHFTKRISGGVEAGPNAVLALKREGYRKTSFSLGDAVGTLTYPGFWRMSFKYWKTGIGEQYRSMVKSVFVRSLQTLIPEIQGEDLDRPGAGVRAQAVDRKGQLLQDFSIAETEQAIHVLNAPSPGATASLTISRYIVDRARESFDLS
jgi:L-2-hydroxyglutarate oxidase LhgO